MVDLLEGYKVVVAQMYNEIPDMGALVGETISHEAIPFVDSFGGYN